MGRELLHDLLSELPAAQAGDDLEFLTRLGQFAFLTPDERIAILDARSTALAASEARLDALAERAPDEFWGSSAIARARAQTTAELRWLKELRAEAARP